MGEHFIGEGEGIFQRYLFRASLGRGDGGERKREKHFMEKGKI